MRNIFFVNPNGVSPCTARRISKVKDERVGCCTVTYRKFHLTSSYQTIDQNGIRSGSRDRQCVQHLDFAFPFIRGGIESIRAVNDIVYRTVGRFAGRDSNENTDANQCAGYTFSFFIFKRCNLYISFSIK